MDKLIFTLDQLHNKLERYVDIGHDFDTDPYKDETCEEDVAEGIIARFLNYLYESEKLEADVAEFELTVKSYIFGESNISDLVDAVLQARDNGVPEKRIQNIIDNQPSSISVKKRSEK